MNITNNYGVKVEDQTVGTNNWAIKTGLGKDRVLSFGKYRDVDLSAFQADTRLAIQLQRVMRGAL